MNKAVTKLPVLAKTWMMVNEAWLVGSAVKWWLRGGKPPLPRDFDFIVPPDKWQDACKLVSLTSGACVRVNSFGGLKVTVDGVELDVWPSHMEDYFRGTPKDQDNYALRFRPYTLIVERRIRG